MRNVILHLSPNKYDGNSKNGSNRKIWDELSKECDEYHVLGRSSDNHFHDYDFGKIKLHTVPGFGRRNASFFVTSMLVGNYCRKYSITGIICQCPLLGGFWATKYANKNHIPVLMELHGNHYFDILNNEKGINYLYGKCIRYSLNNAQTIRALNETMRDKLLETKINNTNIEIVYNRANLELFNCPKENFILHNPIKLISVGNFSPVKNHFLAINAVKNSKFSSQIELILIGGGPLYEDYEKLASSEGVNLKLYDRMPQEDIVNIMSECDLYIHSSDTEGVPRAIIEAMAMRMPIVATNAGMTAGTIIDNKNGLLTSVGDVVQFSNAIDKMLDDVGLRSRLARNAFDDVVSKYEWNSCFDRYRQVIRKTCFAESSTDSLLHMEV